MVLSRHSLLEVKSWESITQKTSVKQVRYQIGYTRVFGEFVDDTIHIGHWVEGYAYGYGASKYSNGDCHEGDYYRYDQRDGLGLLVCYDKGHLYFPDGATGSVVIVMVMEWQLIASDKPTLGNGLTIDLMIRSSSVGMVSPNVESGDESTHSKAIACPNTKLIIQIRVHLNFYL